VGELKTIGLGAMLFASIHNLVQWVYDLPPVINPAFCRYWYNFTATRYEAVAAIPADIWTAGLIWLLTFLFLLGAMAVVWLFVGIKAALLIGIILGILGGFFLGKLFQIGPPIASAILWRRRRN